jgi:acetoin utilization deacetylase AcuC-like enzyme
MKDLFRVHQKEYVRRFVGGKLTRKAVLRIGLPWSRDLVVRSRYSCGATRDACRSAMEEGIAVTLAGGSHHAFSDRGEGYCIFNDCAVAARAMQARGISKRVLIIDCDVHQGNGTAAIFKADDTVFTFSIHGEKNFPFHKEKSDLDIPLKDDTRDDAYLRLLAHGLKRVSNRFKADLAIYIAGADPYFDDRYGRMGLTKEGLAKRDQLVFEYCKNNRLPVAVTMGGGYARKVEDTVDIQFQTVCLSVDYAKIFKGFIPS